MSLTGYTPVLLGRLGCRECFLHQFHFPLPEHKSEDRGSVKNLNVTLKEASLEDMVFGEDLTVLEAQRWALEEQCAEQ